MWHGLYGDDLATDAAFDKRVVRIIRAIQQLRASTSEPLGIQEPCLTGKSSASLAPDAMLKVEAAVGQRHTNHIDAASQPRSTAAAKMAPASQRRRQLNLAEDAIKHLRRLRDSDEIDLHTHKQALRVAVLRWLVASGTVARPAGHNEDAVPFNTATELLMLNSGNSASQHPTPNAGSIAVFIVSAVVLALALACSASSQTPSAATCVAVVAISTALISALHMTQRR